MKTRILVTGSSGFIGYYLCLALLKLENTFVYGADNFSRYKPDNAYKKLSEDQNFQHLNLDLTVMEDVSTIPDVDYVFHLAALNGTKNFYEKPTEVIRSGIIPTLNLIERYRNSSLKRFIFSGTSESYAGAVDLFNYKVPTPEEVPLVISDVRNSRWSYAGAKTLSEIAVASAAQTYGFGYSIVRFHNVYGPRMGDSHVIPEIISRAKNNDFRLFGGDNKRSFVFIDDAIDAIILVAFNESAGGEIYNIGTEEMLNMESLALLIYELMGIRATPINLPAPKGSVAKRCPDTRKIRKIGYRPNVSLKKGLSLTIAYYSH